jgi:hypothetical protein
MAVSPLSINEFIGTGATCAVGINLVVPLAIGAFDRAALLSAAGLYVFLWRARTCLRFKEWKRWMRIELLTRSVTLIEEGWVFTMLGTCRYSRVVALPS